MEVKKGELDMKKVAKKYGYGGLVRTKAGQYQPVIFVIGKAKARKK